MGKRNILITILGSAHYDFTDLPGLTPLSPYLGLKGPINGERVQEIINTYSLAFFDHYLNGGSNQLLQDPAAAFPEVEARLCCPER